MMRVAAVQDAPAFLDLDASVAKAVELIDVAAAHGAQTIGFPGGFIPGRPGWAELQRFDDRFMALDTRLVAHLFSGHRRGGES